MTVTLNYTNILHLLQTVNIHLQSVTLLLTSCKLFAVMFGWVSANVEVSDLTIFQSKQTAFLSNENNKSKFIDMLKAHLRQHGHDVYHSDSDADCFIVECALALSTSRETVVVSDDTDVLDLLIYHCKEGNDNVYMLSEASKCSKRGV